MSAAIAIAEEAGPRPLLAYLLMHHSTDATALATTLGHDTARTQRLLSRLARRGLVTRHEGHYEITPSLRTTVADYVEGALSLRDLAATGASAS